MPPTQRAFIILAHPEPRSFNGAWATASNNLCKAAGYSVVYSDLVSDGFNPVESKKRYTLEPDSQTGDLFDPLKMQEFSSANDSLPEDVSREVEKLRLADTLIIHFPLWWFGPPAILKGWCDRCLVHGALHTIDQRFDNGKFQDKKVLFCVTTGASASECSFAGKEGDVTMLLWPLAYTFRYLGFTVLEPKVLHSIHGYFEGEEERDLKRRLEKELEAHADTISRLNELPAMKFNADSDFNESGTLKNDSPSLTAFIRHAK